VARKRLTLVAVGLTAVFAALGVAFPSIAAARSDWVHWQGQYYACWIPNKHWVVTESGNTLNISSPTGAATVDFAFADNGPASYTLAQVRASVLSAASGLEKVHVLKQGPQFRTGGGGIGQTTSFTALRVRDNTVVRGLATVEIFNKGGSHGFAVYLQGAPKNQWSAVASTLAIIQKRIVARG